MLSKSHSPKKNPTLAPASRVLPRTPCAASSRTCKRGRVDGPLRGERVNPTEEHLQHLQRTLRLWYVNAAQCSHPMPLAAEASLSTLRRQATPRGTWYTMVSPPSASPRSRPASARQTTSRPRTRAQSAHAGPAPMRPSTRTGAARRLCTVPRRPPITHSRARSGPRRVMPGSDPPASSSTRPVTAGASAPFSFCPTTAASANRSMGPLPRLSERGGLRIDWLDKADAPPIPEVDMYLVCSVSSPSPIASQRTWFLYTTPLPSKSICRLD